MVATTIDHFGRLDILINNAAITFIGDLDIPLHRFDLVMQVNMRAPMIAIRQAVPAMRAAGGGSVVNVSSVAALYPHPSLMAYGMSKVALERLTVDAASQLAADEHRRQLLPDRHGRGLRGVRGQHPGRRPLGLGALRGGGRGHRLDGAASRAPTRAGGRACSPSAGGRASWPPGWPIRSPWRHRSS